MAQLQRKMEIGKNLPSVAVGAGYNYHNMLDVDRTFAMVFATVSIPISDWWGGSHAVKRSKLEYQKALDEQQDKSELLKIRMRNAWNSVVESHQQLAIAQQSIEQAAENLRLNQNFYQAGTNKMSDLLEAQMLYQQSLDRRVDAFINYQISLLNYRQAFGQYQIFRAVSHFSFETTRSFGSKFVYLHPNETSKTQEEPRSAFPDRPEYRQCHCRYGGRMSRHTRPGGRAWHGCAHPVPDAEAPSAECGGD